MVIWTGCGILVVFIVFGLGILSQTFLKEILGNNIALFLGYGLAGIIIWFLGKRLNKNKERIVVDKKTNQKIILDSRHTLFWIPFEYWAIVAGIFSLITLFSY